MIIVLTFFATYDIITMQGSFAQQNSVCAKRGIYGLDTADDFAVHSYNIYFFTKEFLL